MSAANQASGASARISFFEETTLGVTPGSPVLYQLAAAVQGVTLKQTVEKLVSKAITNVRGVAAARGGNITVSGSIPFELPIAGLTRLLKHALGNSTTYRAVTLGTGLTGIAAEYVDNATPTGAGTLTLSGSSLTWQANGDGAAGAAVNVAVAGTYTVQSGTAGHAITVVSAGTPSGTTATATVSSTLKVHVLKRGALPVGLGFEIAYTDIGVYHVFNGCRINKLSLKLGNSGFATGTLDITGVSSVPNATSLGVPTAYAHVPYVQHEAMFKEAGVVSDITDVSFDLENAFDPVRCVGSRMISGLREGQGNLSGKATYLFEGPAVLNRVIDETEQDLHITFAATGTYAGQSADFWMPKTKLFGDAGVGIPTDKGLVQSADLQATIDATQGSDIVVTITSTEQSI